MSATSIDNVLLVDTREAAKRLSISQRTLWTLTNVGEIPVVRVGRKKLYDPADLRQWIDARKVRGSPKS